MKAITQQWLDFAKAGLKSCKNNIHKQVQEMFEFAKQIYESTLQMIIK